MLTITLALTEQNFQISPGTFISRNIRMSYFQSKSVISVRHFPNGKFPSDNFQSCNLEKIKYHWEITALEKYRTSS